MWLVACVGVQQTSREHEHTSSHHNLCQHKCLNRLFCCTFSFVVLLVPNFMGTNALSLAFSLLLLHTHTLSNHRHTHAHTFVRLFAIMVEWPIRSPPQLIHTIWKVHLSPSAFEGSSPIARNSCNSLIEAHEEISSLQSQVI